MFLVNNGSMKKVSVTAKSSSCLPRSRMLERTQISISFLTSVIDRPERSV